MSAVVMSRFSYPKVPGDTPWSVIDVSGPEAYEQIVIGQADEPPDGGQEITAADFGIQSLDFIASMGSDDGQCGVHVIPAHFFEGDSLTEVLLQWITLADGAEVDADTDLSDFTVRLLAIGR